MNEEPLFEEKKYKQPIPVPHTKRLINYLVDTVFFNIILGLVIVIGNLVRPEWDFLQSSANAIQGLYNYLLTGVLYAFFLGATEALFSGRTLGKLITGTRAVNIDGSPISVHTAFQRGLCRAIPFSVFSAIGPVCYPWHDRWTKTVVISESYIE